MSCLARLQEMLPQDAQEQLSLDKYLLSFRVMHASAFSLSLKTQGHSFDFDPVLFGRRVVEQRRVEGESVGPICEAESLLTDHQSDIFAKERFRSSDLAKSSYVIERGVYLYLDPSLRAAMTTANHVIHLSRWWNPAVEDQCTDRVYRIGQDQTVHVYYPMAVHPAYGESSFDELLNSLLTRKRDLSQRMLVPPVNVKEDQQWFADNLGRKIPRVTNAPTDLEEIDSMEPKAFERWALGLCISFGWEAYRTPQSYDGGADGILVHRVSGARSIVQCKHTQSDKAACGPEAIDDLLRARSNYAPAARLFVLSNAERFTRTAHERAEMHGIRLISRKELLHWPKQLLS